MGFASKTGSAVLALSLLSGSAWAAASCARPQEVTALQAAALQQQLMVAALACHDIADYNRFVTSYQGELQKSDKALMNFFLRRDAHKGADGYNAYKTSLANASSLRSLHDPKFCRSAKVVFDVALNRKGSLAELASQRPSPIETGYVRCVPGAPETMLFADATPRLPVRHQALLDSLPSTSVVGAVLPSRQERALPPAPPHSYADGPRTAGQLQARESYERDAYDRDANTRDADERDNFDRDGTETREDADAGNEAPPRYADAASAPTYDRSDDGYGDDAGDYSDDRDGYDNGPTANNAPGTYRNAYAPDGYGSAAHPRLVPGPDGRWYLLPPYGR
jgi:hypothetical protein